MLAESQYLWAVVNVAAQNTCGLAFLVFGFALGRLI